MAAEAPLTKSQKKRMKQKAKASVAADLAEAGVAAPQAGKTYAMLKAEGNSAFAAGRYDEAVKLYTQALSLNSTEASLYSNRAAAFLKRKKAGDLESALADAETCVEKKPEWSKGWGRVGAAAAAAK